MPSRRPAEMLLWQLLNRQFREHRLVKVTRWTCQAPTSHLSSCHAELVNLRRPICQGCESDLSRSNAEDATGLHVALPNVTRRYRAHESDTHIGYASDIQAGQAFRIHMQKQLICAHALSKIGAVAAWAVGLLDDNASSEGPLKGPLKGIARGN